MIPWKSIEFMLKRKFVVVGRKKKMVLVEWNREECMCGWYSVVG